ncbi:MAG TPA: AtpZ/AtpI family protein [Candidatus Acidoferrales bacterium]|jgi:ATP synthase protein I|nr:AtpZ/AtpI family protein [Candidatus Acidoferrales bacterium]
MSGNNTKERLKASVEAQTGQIRKAERQRRTLLANTVYLGTLGLILVLPIVAGAYLGNWLDNRIKGYSFSWTITLIVLGVFVGSVDVYLFVQGR